MACACTSTTCSYSLTSGSHILLLVLLLLGLSSWSCYGLGSFGFNIHHRFSDPVKQILGFDGLPEKRSVEYYVAMAHRDHIIRGRHLAASNNQSPPAPLTFANGNETIFLNNFGSLYYANVSVGTPSLSYLVALDTGSDLFWLPCDCSNSNTCVTGLQTSSGQVLNLNIYSPNASSTSKKVPCGSNYLCSPNQCLSANSGDCAYSYAYVSNDTSTSGILVEDVLHLITDDQSKAVDALVTLGCGKNETGIFLEGAAPNGLMGLGLNNISVPSTLARNGLGPNSFSMCFGSDVIGRINFGDNGTSDQKATPFTVESSFATYNITITQINIGGGNVSQMEFNAIFDSGTSFTYLSDPAYTFISQSFNSQVTEKRYPSNSQIPFEYCYYLSANQIQYTSYTTPTVNLTMKGGDQYFVTDPTVLFSTQAGYFYCLGLLKSEGINIIGQNFMTGYRIVFNHDKMVLGWKASNCYNDSNSQTSPTNPSQSPALAVNPKSTAPSSHSPKLKAFTYTLVMLLVSFFAIV
ncbi:hypothetical protein RGQ29_021839 [Quercus rubra]|uniref:Peptidase A1 domain-containing protein n=1 Tax=Quercus rubra TaxID=3512 RepID=A0AAN7F276_QUERU|nr:hypothetical protein RGQ29_021839 [Quercus rubra]